MNNLVNCIVYITDSNYAMPTCISICSVVDSYLSSTPLNIYVLCDDVSDVNIRKIENISVKDKPIKVIIRTVSSEEYEELSRCMVEYSDSFHVSRTAILKFSLPSLFKDINTILYLDCDTLMQSGFEYIFDEDISKEYLAAVDDMGDYEDEEGQSFLASRLGIKCRYFNSGIMLLNLNNMRKDRIEQKLFEYKKYGINHFMDQDALNVIIGNKRKSIPYQYNFRAALTQVMTFDEINREFYCRKYMTMEECISDQRILHLTDSLKPWKYYMSWFTDIFKKYYEISPYAGQELPLLSIEVYYNRRLREEENTRIKMSIENKKMYGSYNDKYFNSKVWRIPTELISKGSRVVIYGAGKVGKSIRKQNKIYGYFDLVLWVDRDYKSMNEDISSPEDLYAYDYDYVLIALAERKTADLVREELYKNGITWNKIVTLYDKEDAVEKAIMNSNLLPAPENIRNQTWNQFGKQAKGRRIILFGAGKGAKTFLTVYRNEMHSLLILDNDPNKWGKKITNYIPEAIPYVAEGKLNADIIAPNNEFVSKFDKNTVIVITLLKDVDSVINQLSEMGFNGMIFSVLSMEANRRKAEYERRAPIIRYEEDAVRYFESFEINKKKILFCTNMGFSDHGKYIAMTLAKRGMDLDLVFIGKIPQRRGMPKGIRFVKPDDSMQVAYEMETAGFWIFNSDVPEIYRKREGQVYIQTKHWSSVTLKKFFLDIKLYKSDSYRHKRLVEHGKMIDYIIAGSDFDIETCRSGFGYYGEFWKIGSPRSDALWNRHSIKNNIYKKFGLPGNVKILMYAPTYRADSLNSSYGRVFRDDRLDYKRITDSLEKRFGGDWIIFLRLHPAVANEMEFTILPNNVVNVSREQDSEELVAASDAMLTDYSSIMFEPAYIELPVFLLAEDLEEYQKQVDFWIPYEELPFPIAKNKKQLDENIMNFDEDKYKRDLRGFFDRYDVHEDGHASERAADMIAELIEHK